MKGLKRELRDKRISRYLFVLLIMLFVINISRWGSITAKAASDIPKELIITEAGGNEVQVIQNGKYVTTSGNGWSFKTSTIPPYLVLEDAKIEKIYSSGGNLKISLWDDNVMKGDIIFNAGEEKCTLTFFVTNGYGSLTMNGVMKALSDSTGSANIAMPHGSIIKTSGIQCSGKLSVTDGDVEIIDNSVKAIIAKEIEYGKALVTEQTDGTKKTTVHGAFLLRKKLTIADGNILNFIDGAKICNMERLELADGAILQVNGTKHIHNSDGGMRYINKGNDYHVKGLACKGCPIDYGKEEKEAHNYNTDGFCISYDGYQQAVLTNDQYDINGDGKKDNVYEISNAGQLYWFAALVNGKLPDTELNDNNANAILKNDIIVNSGVVDGVLAKNTSGFRRWTPIGYYGYGGVFDGQGHMVKGLYINDTNRNSVGLCVGLLNKGCIKNLGIEDSYFNEFDVGGVADSNYGTIINCYCNGVFVANNRAGGIVSDNYGTIMNCNAVTKITAEEGAGGIAGSNSGTITNCYSIAEITADYDKGEIAGSNYETITNCYYLSDEEANEDNGVTGKTKEQFASGEVAFCLQNEEKETVWGQAIGTDSYPVLSGERVYKIGTYKGCEEAPGEKITDTYSNSNKNIYQPHTDDGSQGGTAYDNKCDFCGKELHDFKEDGSCNEDGCNYHKGTITNAFYSTKIVYCGDDTNVEPNTGDFTVDSGTEPAFVWYRGDVITGDLSNENILATPPKEPGTYTLVVNAAGAEKEGVIYTTAELRVKVTIEKGILAGTVSLAGTAKYGENLTVITKEITNEKPGTYSYQWYRIDEDEKVTEIANATGESYTLTTEDIGKKIKVVVTSAYCEGSLETKINVTVRKAVPSYQVPTDISATCRAKLSTIQLPNGFEWTDEDVTLEAGDTETGTQVTKKAKYVPKDTKNYEEVTDIEITIQVTHDSELKGVVEPTCTEKGYSGDTYCKNCNKKLQSGMDVDALDHEFSKDFTVDTEATCKSVGSKSRHCIRCEEKTEITEIPKSDHAWDDGKITKEATETAEGVKTYSCKVCGVTRTETIPKKDAVTTQQPTEGSTVSQSPKNGDTITDNKSNAKYTVTDTVKKNVTYIAPVTIKAKTITIPATIKINGEIYKVTRIHHKAMKGPKKVTKIVVGSNIQSIGNYAFSGCKKLKTIIIQSKKLTTKTVSKKAFKGIAKKVVVKVPKKKRTAYKKLLKKKGLSSKNRIKNY